MNLQTVPTAKCFESATNPRGKKFEGPEFDGLVKSIAEQGILMPILVRPQDGKFEVIAGNRRFRAAQQLKLADIPAQVVEMTDIEAREAQIVENLQRADVHPLQEGAAYRDLIEQSGYDIAAVAAKVGKSESYVRDRLVLTNLSKEGQRVFRDGIITAGHAALVSRLDPEQQKDALDFLQVDADEWWREVPTTAELRTWIQERAFAEAMKNPPWQGDEEMKAALGGCDECKGKGGDLWGKKASDACTNPKCYATRIAAYIETKLKTNPGLVKLSGSYTGSEDAPGYGQWHAITSKKDGCDHEEKGIVIEGNGVGHVMRFCRAPECKKHWASQTPHGHYKPSAEEIAKRKKARAAEAKAHEKQTAEILAGLERVKLPLSDKQVDVLFDLALRRAGTSYQQPVIKRHAVKAIVKANKYGDRRDYEATVRKIVADEKSQDAKLRMVFELLLPDARYSADDLKLVLKRL